MAPNDPSSVTLLRLRWSGEDCPDNGVPYAQDCVPIVSDDRPWLEVFATGDQLVLTTGPKAKELNKKGLKQPQPASSGQPTWRRLMLGHAVKEERRLGLYEYGLRSPRGAVLRCYLVPRKLLKPADVWAMLQALRSELDLDAAWDPQLHQPQSAAPAWVDRVEGSTPVFTDRLIEEVERELVSARDLHRRPITEPGFASRELQAVPEMSLLSRWSVRRATQLREQVESLEEQLAELEEFKSTANPTGRQKDAKAYQRQLRGHVKNLRDCQIRIHALRVPPPGVGTLPFGPLMQRDHRLRSLLGAFAPTPAERFAEQRGAIGRYPMTTLNDLFEIWGAVWLAHQLRAMGWHGCVLRRSRGRSMPSAQWGFHHGDVKVTLDYEPRAKQVKLDALPSLDERDVPAHHWAASRTELDPDRPFFTVKPRASPDYLLRIEGPAGQALAVGDATLADPDFQDRKRNKLNKLSALSDYARNLYWWTPKRSVPVTPMGAFVLLPGPAATWESFEPGASEQDTWLLSAQPSLSVESPAPRFRRMMSLLLRRVGSSLPNVATPPVA